MCRVCRSRAHSSKRQRRRRIQPALGPVLDWLDATWLTRTASDITKSVLDLDRLRAHLEERSAMKRLLVITFAAVVGGVGLAQDGAAQNLIITNARVLDGRGGMIQSGSVVVRDGKIVSVSAGAAPAASGVRVIDARGMTVMPS